MTMTSRERFAAMLNHKTPDRMPVYPLVNSISRQSLGITYEEWTKDINKCDEAIIRTTDELELDCLCTLVDLSVEAADFGQELLCTSRTRPPALIPRSASSPPRGITTRSPASIPPRASA